MTHNQWQQLKDDLRYLQAAIRDVERTPDLPEYVKENLWEAAYYIRTGQINLEVNYAWDKSAEPT